MNKKNTFGCEKTCKNILLFDNELKKAYYFCTNINWCLIKENKKFTALKRYIKKKMDYSFTVVKFKIRQDPSIKKLNQKQVKAEIKLLLWTFLFIELKINNKESSKFDNDTVFEYFLINLKKRNLTNILVNFYKKITLFPKLS